MADKTKHIHSPSARASDSAGIGWDSQIYMSSKCPGDAEAADGATFWEPLRSVISDSCMLQETQTTIQQLHKKTLPTVTNAALREKNMVPKQWRAGLAGYTGWQDPAPRVGKSELEIEILKS